MDIKKEDETLGRVAASFFEKKEDVCPTHEEFTLYLEGKLDKNKKDAIMSHFLSCQECQERLSVPTYHPKDATEGGVVKRFLSFLPRPILVAPIAAVFLILAAVGMDVYLKSHSIPEQSYRSADLVDLEQINLTPNLMKIIKEGDREGLKSELIKELPPGARVSRISVEDKIKEAKEGDKINLILYNDGLLKLKLGE